MSSYTSLAEKILFYLVDISNQKYTITDDVILKETDPNIQLILTGLLNLSEELMFLEKERAKSLEDLVEKKKLLRANRELKDFAYIVSHDLKSPLRGISTISEWLCRDYHDVIDQEGKELLNLMVEKVIKLERLIDDILDYSKVGRREEIIVEVNLNKVIQEVLHSLDSPDSFEFVISDLPIVTGIKTEWHQVFLNLISNSINYNDKAKGEVKISYSLDGSRLILDIYDNGPGIPTRYHKKIFELFQTLNVDYNPNSTGIGLSTVKKIVELNDGEISVKSDGKLGTRFLIELPALVVVGIAP